MSSNEQKLLGLSIPHTYDPEFKKVTIRNAQTFPKELFSHADAVEILDMSGGQLHELPEDLGKLDQLRIAFFSNNPLGRVPKSLAGCTKLEMVGLKSCSITSFDDGVLPAGLRGLILTDNHLTKLPPSIGTLSSLQKLMLAGNDLKTLPSELAQCYQLQLLRLPVNALTEIPDWLWELPSLAWYSDAANPGSYKPKLPHLETIFWNELEMGDRLGGSAKNVVHRAKLKRDSQEVAVKLFGDGMTTDGTPDDEMRASVMAGTHPNLTSVIDKIVDAPNGQRGLVMELVPPDFTTLGLPPDFVTLTRDVLIGKFAPPVVIKILLGVSAALGRLHQQGIMHGDVYAHNILANPEGYAYMSDLGAASLYDVARDGGKRERLDVRGFGYLVDDLLPHIVPAGNSKLEQLKELRDACLRPGNKTAIRFDEIRQRLQSL